MLSSPQQIPVDYTVVYNIPEFSDILETKKDILLKLLNIVYGNENNYIELKLKEKPTYSITKHLENGLFVNCLKCDLNKNLKEIKTINSVSKANGQFQFKINNNLNWSVQINKMNTQFVVIKKDNQEINVEDCSFLKHNPCRNSKMNFFDYKSAEQWKQKILNSGNTNHIKTNIPIEKKDYILSKIIKKGDNVHLTYKKGFITIKTQAIALSSGSLLENIQVKLPFKNSNENLFVKVVDKGTVVYEK